MEIIRGSNSLVTQCEREEVFVINTGGGRSRDVTVQKWQQLIQKF